MLEFCKISVFHSKGLVTSKLHQSATKPSQVKSPKCKCKYHGQIVSAIIKEKLLEGSRENVEAKTCTVPVQEGKRAPLPEQWLLLKSFWLILLPKFLSYFVCLSIKQLFIINCFGSNLFPIFFKLFRSRFLPIFEEGAKFQVDLSMPHIATIATIAPAQQPQLTLWFMLAAIVPERNVGPRLSVIAANLKKYWRCQI